MWNENPGTLLRPGRAIDAFACRVCGHRTIPPARPAINSLLLVLIGLLFGYLALDVAHDGRLNRSLFTVITQSWEDQAQ